MHIVERLCVSCRENYEPKSILRVAKIDGEFVLDIGQKLGGRGAYICSNCIDKVVKKKLLNKSFKQAVPIEVYEKIEEYEKNS